MARVPSKHSRDQVQDWELSFKDKDKDKKLKSQSLKTEEKLGGSMTFLRNYDTINQISTSLVTKENSVDANSEKDLGNEHFKQKRYNDAVDCYSRSIAFSPSAVAYANRAMAYIKINRFQEAEYDCTEALCLDDRYIKAYSRRITSRKKLGKLKEALEDADFALRLEPSNQEIKKQHAEVKSMLQEEILKKASVISQRSTQGVQKADISKKVNGSTNGAEPVPSNFSREDNREIISDISLISDGGNFNVKCEEVPLSREFSLQSRSSEIAKRSNKTGKRDLDPSVQELAARAATLAKSEAAKNISPPTTAYQFEVSWRGLDGDHYLQAQLLKATSPSALPQLFKNALSAGMLIDIVRCIATFIAEDTDSALKYLENLTKVPRFDMIVMCLSSSDKADLRRIWYELMSRKTCREHSEILARLQPKYRIQLQ